MGMRPGSATVGGLAGRIDTLTQLGSRHTRREPMSFSGQAARVHDRRVPRRVDVAAAHDRDDG